MDSITIIGVIFIFLLLTWCVLLGLALRKRCTRLEDADLPGQVKEIISKVTGEDAAYFDLVPAKTMETTVKMIADSLITHVVKAATGHTIYTYDPGEDFLIIFGQEKMFFVSYYFDFKTKTINPDFNKISEITKSDLIKIKTKKYSDFIFYYTTKTSIYFGVQKQYHYKVPASENSIQRFKEFIKPFVDSVNSKNYYITDYFK